MNEQRDRELMMSLEGSPANEIRKLRAEVERLTRERDEARANISEVIDPAFFDKIMAAAVSEKELAAIRAEVERLREALREIAEGQHSEGARRLARAALAQEVPHE